MPMDQSRQQDQKPDRMTSEYRIEEADETLALRLVGWIVADCARADRLLGLTGLDPAALHAGLADPAVLGALMGFVIDHEPDLLACAQALAVPPASIVAARGRLAA
jgi:hypothetical protein